MTVGVNTRYGSDEDIVSRLLARSSQVAVQTARLASDFAVLRGGLRDKLKAQEEIVVVSEEMLEAIPTPSQCAVDGAMICDSRAIGDICAAIGVTVGPGDNQRNDVFMETVPRKARNGEIVRGIMAGMEIRLAAESDADIVFIDGSLLSGLISISKAISHSQGRRNAMEERAMEMIGPEMRDAIMEVLTSKRHVAVPKYTTDTADFAEHLPAGLEDFDGRTVATMALKPGEMMRLFNTEKKTRADLEIARRTTRNVFGFSEAAYEEFLKASTSVVHSYYRPHFWTPAFRFDVPFQLFDDKEAGKSVLKALHTSTLAPGFREPLPLFLVDRFAKQISVGVAPVMDMAAAHFSDDDEALLLMLMGYRT